MTQHAARLSLGSLHVCYREGGEIGDITMMRAYRMESPIGSATSGPVPAGKNELMYQISRFHSFLWLSGGVFSDFLIHNIDESCWMKNAWPVRAVALGGRHYRGDSVDQNFDVNSVEYTFEEGTKLFMDGRNMHGCHAEFASYAHGTKGLAVVSTAAHTPAKCRIYRGHYRDKANLRNEGKTTSVFAWRTSRGATVCDSLGLQSQEIWPDRHESRSDGMCHLCCPCRRSATLGVWLTTTLG